jgi:hypothetical protein
MTSASVVPDAQVAFPGTHLLNGERPEEALKKIRLS